MPEPKPKPRASKHIDDDQTNKFFSLNDGHNGHVTGSCVSKNHIDSLDLLITRRICASAPLRK